MAVATRASAMPGATVASVTCCRLARPVKACMMPQTVPNRPTYGETEPTEARNDRLDSTSSISRWKLARMARRAPSSRVPVGDAPLAQLLVLAHAAGEDALHRACRLGVLGGRRKQVVQAGARPELALEGLR
jgi:hypothetical protein